ncbi:MAG: hypothetical protein Q8L48_36360 [Archangium sp.]|nr:hypothetical protein [Archangium sp.]
METWTRLRRLASIIPRGASSPIDRLRWALAQAESHGWERYFGVDTRRAAAHGQTAVPAESIAYEPLPWFLVRHAVGALELSHDDVFLDYGAGLGRALLMAARTKLKRVVGVELLKPLADSATKNVLTARHRLRTPVEVVVADAAAWDVPDDVTVAYLFNPFVGTVMAAAQAKIRASLTRRPRSLRVLYAHADDQPDLFAACDWLRPRRQLGGGIYKGLTLRVYGN